MIEGGPNWLHGRVHRRFKRWRWKAHVGYTAEGVLQAPLCGFLPCIHLSFHDDLSNIKADLVSSQWINIASILYGVVVALIKLSILLQYLRIFVPNRNANMPLFVAIQIVIWIIGVFYFLDVVIELNQCNPRKRIWNPLMTTGHCININPLYLATGVFNVVSDFAVLILPMVPIWKLQLPWRRRILMIAIFATGVW
jgi:hypothetical protein